MAAQGQPRRAPDPQAAVERAVAAVLRRFPGREPQIKQLAVNLLPSSGLPGTCLLWGPRASGKTSVVRDLLSELRLRHAYIDCAEDGGRPRHLLASLLLQLKGGWRRADDKYESGVKCDSLAELRLQLPGVMRSRSTPASASTSASPCWLVLDRADRLAGSDLLAGLLRLREDLGVDLAVLLVGTAPWGSGRYLRDTAPAPPPKQLHFPPYRPEQLQKILEARRQEREGEGAAAEAAPYRQFLTAFVPAFCRASNSLWDLEAAVERLFPLYVRPLREGQQLQAITLYRRISDEVRQVLQELQLQGGARGGTGAAQAGDGAAAADDAAAARRASSFGLAFELAHVSKFLLLAAYIASRNKPTTDRTVFDPDYKKRGRRHAQAHDRQVEAALEAKLRGPHSFPLERLLNIFWVIYASHAEEEEEEDEEDDEAPARKRQRGGAEAAATAEEEEAKEGREGRNEQGRNKEAARWRNEAHRVMQQAEVLHQVSSLVTLRFLERCSGDVLEGQLYRCGLGEEMAAALAANVQLRLTDYLRMG